MSSEEQLKKEFFEECMYAFGFLIDEYGFAGPEIEDHKHIGCRVYFCKKEIAAQCSLDIRDEMGMFYIVRLDNGKKPDCYRMNDRGEIVREDLHSLLIYGRGVRELRGKDPPDRGNLSQRRWEFRTLFYHKKYLLRKYGQDLLDGSADIFNGYDAPGDRF